VRKTLLLLTIAVLCLGTFASADSFITSGCRACGFTTDVIDWGQLGDGSGFTFVNTPAIAFSAGGTNAALVGNANGGQFLQLISGFTWNGNFDFGENLVWTGNPNFGVGSGGPFVIELANPVGGIGFGIQADLFGPFLASVDIYDSHLNYMTTLSFLGNSSSSLAGDNLFIGIQDKTAVNIGALVIHTDSGDPIWANDFALDAVSFNYTTPEPGSLMLLGSGLIGVAGVIRRKTRG
jgi:PEP-CTERM motif-containing protein